MIYIKDFDLPTLKAFAHDFEKIFYTGNASEMTAYYTADAKLIAEGIEPITGLEAIEAFWKASCQRGKSLHMQRKIIVEDIKPSAELSYAYCTLLLHIQMPDGGVVNRVVKDITIWRLQPDGLWRIEVDISVPSK